MPSFSLFIDNTLQEWERSYFSALAKHLGAECIQPARAKMAALRKTSGLVWVVSRDWSEMARRCSRPQMYFSPLGLHEGSINFFKVLFKKLLGEGPPTQLVVHSDLSFRFFSEVDKKTAGSVTKVELPYLSGISPLFSRASSDAGALEVGVLSHFGQGANINSIASIAHYVRRQNANILFHVVGAGALSKHYKNQMTRLGLKDTVFIESTLPKGMDVLFQPLSQQEHSMDIFLAGGVSVPVVSYDTVEARKWIHDAHNGFLVPVHDTKTAGELLLRLAGDVRMRDTLGKNLNTSFNENLRIQQETALREFFGLEWTPRQVA